MKVSHPVGVGVEGRAERAQLSTARALPGILILSAAVLLLELSLTRAFAVVLWGHLTPLVIGSALFGFSLSGLYGHFQDRPRSPAFLSLLFAAGTLLLAVVIDYVPLRLWGEDVEWINLGIYYLALIVPFFAAGLAILRIFSDTPTTFGRIYAADLLGAGIGCLFLVPLLPWLFGEGTVVASAALAALAATVLASRRSTRFISFFVTVLLTVLSFRATDFIEFLPHTLKRDYNYDVRHNRLLFTTWSALSRVDIAEMLPGLRRIWIDGGTNESAMFRDPERYFGNEPWRKHSAFLPYHVLGKEQVGRVMIIGPAGGKEVWFALHGGAENVDAVEMDPGVVRAVGTEFDGFLRGLYNDPRVRLINDEGRSFLRHEGRLYDVIQSVNNYSPVALLSGALNLSESFVLTKEAFHDYLDHLNPGGLIAFHRGASMRLAILAAEVLEERGVEDPGTQIAVVQGETPFFESFFVKKGAFSEEEKATLVEYSKVKKLPIRYLRGHDANAQVYVDVIDTENREAAFSKYKVDLRPPTDDWPFLDHYSLFGKQKLRTDLPREFHVFETRKWAKRIPQGDVAYLAILIESLLLGALLIGLPVWLGFRRQTERPSARVLVYFACLGAGFILVELCLMKQIVLFLGHPVYSISATLFTLLVGAAIGSALSTGIRRPWMASLMVVGMLAVETILMPWVFDLALGAPFLARIMIVVALLTPMSVVLGMPFPAVMARLREEAPGQIPLAWALNGYGTVVGSASCVFLAVFFGFQATYGIAAALYLIAALTTPYGEPGRS